MREIRGKVVKVMCMFLAVAYVPLSTKSVEMFDCSKIGGALTIAGRHMRPKTHSH
jgi:hypothetical protein